ncbi:hypothetical protein TWF481_002923 [Arthrobotrys musiformis]|uniref:Uncharacterized protein n=1 Tax=Arthrobotrys musiformis TaxID=47236 RepID=A0AAV9VRU7_9PEZI
MSSSTDGPEEYWGLGTGIASVFNRGNFTEDDIQDFADLINRKKAISLKLALEKRANISLIRHTAHPDPTLTGAIPCWVLPALADQDSYGWSKDRELQIQGTEKDILDGEFEGGEGEGEDENRGGHEGDGGVDKNDKSEGNLGNKGSVSEENNEDEEDEDEEDEEDENGGNGKSKDDGESEGDEGESEEEDKEGDKGGDGEDAKEDEDGDEGENERNKVNKGNMFNKWGEVPIERPAPRRYRGPCRWHGPSYSRLHSGNSRTQKRRASLEF